MLSEIAEKGNVGSMAGPPHANKVCCEATEPRGGASQLKFKCDEGTRYLKFARLCSPKDRSRTANCSGHVSVPRSLLPTRRIYPTLFPENGVCVHQA